MNNNSLHIPSSHLNNNINSNNHLHHNNTSNIRNPTNGIHDDSINILSKKNNNSMNGSSSDVSIVSTNGTQSTRYRDCCTMLSETMNKYYYSIFCCYSTTSHAPHTPLCWSWLSIFCCCCPLLGLISLYFTHKSKKLKLKNKYEEAEKYSGYAEKLNIAALIFGVIFYAIAVFIITLVIFMYWRKTTNS
jgi:hypothetical protein